MNVLEITPLTEFELDDVDGGMAESVFRWLGIAGAIEWAGEKAYAAGVWVGEHS